MAEAKPPEKHKYEVIVGHAFLHKNEINPPVADGTKGGFNPSDETHYKVTTGDVVESIHDLTKRFPNKFRRVMVPAPPPVSEQRKRMVQNLLDKEGCPYAEEDRDTLEQLNEKSFVMICKAAGMSLGLPIPTPGTPIPPAASDKPPVNALGEDVTEFYPLAKANKLHVFKNEAGKYNVLKGRSKKPINETALNAETVGEFIGNHLGGDAGEEAE